MESNLIEALGSHLTDSTKEGTKREDEESGLSDGEDDERPQQELTEEDHKALMNDIEDMIKYDEDDEEVESRGMLD